MIRSLFTQGFTLLKSILIADKGFDCLILRNLLRRFQIKALIKVNHRNSKKIKCGRKKFFDEELYSTRYINERTFAWMDSYRTLLVRFDTTTESWKNWHFIAGFLMIAKV
ncbi:MAG: transposase [Ignavibacteriae bacterium]|nr:transposase [Ignavibacteriota bacterium]